MNKRLPLQPLPDPFPEEETRFLLPGPAGDLEVIATPAVGAPQPLTVIVCHPHPLYQGTMENKVVTTVVRAYKNAGYRCVRFNFRGVGESAGEYDEAVGERDDLEAVIAWVKQRYPEEAMALVGFSFGSFIAASAATQHACRFLVCIAPPVHHFDFSGLPEFTCPCAVLQGEADEVVPPDEVYAWVASRRSPPKLVQFPEVGHFFHGHLVHLKEALLAVSLELIYRI